VIVTTHPVLSRLARHAGRIALTVVLGGLLGATLVRFAPGFGVDEAELDSRLSSQSIAALRQSQPGTQSLASFYWQYLVRLFHGDLGTSRSLQRPVAELLRERWAETAKSVALGLTLGWLLGMSLAIAVVTSRSWVDLFASLLGGTLLCLPAAVLALLFLIARMPGRLILALIVFPNIFRYARNLLVRSAASAHVLTARAKGLGNLAVLFRHVLWPAAPQLLALAGVSTSIAFTSAIPVEALCDLPGLGQLAWKAALSRDLYLLVTLTMIVSVVTLGANSLADLLAQACGHHAAEVSA
jgi:peptide/nickel transport system permease protein